LQESDHKDVNDFIALKVKGSIKGFIIIEMISGAMPLSLDAVMPIEPWHPAMTFWRMTTLISQSCAIAEGFLYQFKKGKRSLARFPEHVLDKRAELRMPQFRHLCQSYPTRILRPRYSWHERVAQMATVHRHGCNSSSRPLKME
jgi:hypothetical protein